MSPYLSPSSLTACLERIADAAYVPSSTSSGSLPSDLLFSVLLSKSLLALSLHISRDWLIAQGYPIWTLNAVSLAVGGVGLALWEKSWEPPRGGKRRAVSCTNYRENLPGSLLSSSAAQFSRVENIPRADEAFLSCQNPPSLLYPVLFAFENLFALYAVYRLSVIRCVPLLPSSQ